MCTQVDPENPLCQVPPLPSLPTLPSAHLLPRFQGNIVYVWTPSLECCQDITTSSPRSSCPLLPQFSLPPSGGDVGELSQPGSGLSRPHRLLAQHTYQIAMESPWHASFIKISRTRTVYEYDIVSIHCLVQSKTNPGNKPKIKGLGTKKPLWIQV